MKTELKYGFLAGFAYALWNMAECSWGFYTELSAWLSVSKSLSVVIPTLFLVLGLWEENKKQAQAGHLLGKGVQIAFATAMFNLVGMVLYFEYLNPEFNRQILDYVTHQALQNGANVALVRQTAELTHSISGVLLSNFISNLAVGTLISVALMFYLPKAKPYESNFVMDKTAF